MTVLTKSWADTRMHVNLGLSLEKAMQLHEQEGGYLLHIGCIGGSLSTDRDCYDVVSEADAIDLYGRTPEQLRWLDDRGFSEAEAGPYPKELVN